MHRLGNIHDAELCNGSTTDSDSVCEGSNPSSAAKTEKADANASVFLVLAAMKRTLRCIKNEVACGYEACLRHIKKKCSLLHARRSLVLHVGEANASFFIEKI